MDIINSLKGGLIVSCQALPGEPLYIENDTMMPLMARAAKRGGACAIRTNGVMDVVKIKEETGLPVIGIIKKVFEGIGIIPQCYSMRGKWNGKAMKILLIYYTGTYNTRYLSNQIKDKFISNNREDVYFFRQ